MAITAARQTSDFSGFISPAQADAIFERAAKMSVVQRLVRRIPLGASGVEVPVTTTRPTAGWVSEGAAKPASQGALTLKTMTPKKIGAIAVQSSEVVRANPGGYMSLLREWLAEAFAVAFDKAALYDQGPDGTAGAGPFDTFINQTAKSVELGTATQATGGIYKDIVAGLSLLVADDKKLTGFAFDLEAEPLFLGATDTSGRPLFIDSPPDDTALTSGRLIGRPAFIGDGVASDTAAEIMGFGGDWTQAAWGAVGGISYTVSTEATVTINGALVSLFENNLVAIRAEAEYGWLVNDTAAFVKYANATP